MSQFKITYRPATPFDAPRIAELHTRSWRETYRGDMSDEYLDHIAPDERLKVWTQRFSEENESLRVFLAEDEKLLVGFCCLLMGHSRQDGTLLDNLHVHSGYRKHGIGKHLLHWAADEALHYDPSGKLHLWVLETNVPAREMYKHVGGTEGRSEQHFLPGSGQFGVTAVAVHFDPAELRRRTAA